MDLEEQRLKHDVDVREEALKEKVRILKERVEDLKRMTDVKSQVESRPVWALAGSFLAGFVARKWVGRKNRRSADGSRGDHSSVSANAGVGLLGPVTAILSAIATRAVVGIVTELAKEVMPHRHEKQRTDRSHSDN